VSSYQGCSVYDSSLIGSSDADDGTSPGTDAAAPPCNHAYPPEPPQIVDASGNLGSSSIFAAFNSIDIGVAGGIDAAIPPFGYDLDHDCTCPGQRSCTPRSGAPPAESCDDKRGRDNIDIQLFRLLESAASAGTTQIDQGLSAGQYGLLLEIQDYNGTENDPVVTVNFYVSNGLNRDADGGIPTPKLDGTDRWTIDPSSYVGQQTGGTPAYTADVAYVTGGTLVAHIPQSIPIAFGDRSFLGGATMELYGAVIVGQLQLQQFDSGIPNSFGFAITQGTIAGRWSTRQLLSTLATIPEEGGFLCLTDPSLYNQYLYKAFKAVACLAADISQDPSNDNKGVPCDAISVGMQFTAVPALRGDDLMVAHPPAGCQQANGAPWSDQCPP
jgi:hypothetical protein